MTRTEAETTIILRCEVGSTAHGVSVGNDDRDEMGVLIEPFDEAMGIGSPFEQYIYRDAAHRTGKQDAPSEAGDLDLTLYSLRKWIRLAFRGNPTILSLLFAPVIQTTSLGTQLRELAPKIISRQVGKQYLGYMQSQRMKMIGDKCNRVKRPDLVEQFGFDTKFAYHMLRLGLQGEELLLAGKFSMPITGPNKAFLLQVRKGEVSQEDCLETAAALETIVKDLMVTGPLPEAPDAQAVEEWMLDTYYGMWSATYGHERTKRFAAIRARNLAAKGLTEATAPPSI